MTDKQLHPPDPPLAVDRVRLRPFRLEDAPAISRACASADIPRYTFMPAGLTVEGAEDWIRTGLDWWPRGVARFAITEGDDDEPLGQVGASFEWLFRRAEAFYWLAPQARGRGLATVALGLVTDWALQAHGAVRVQLLTHPDNVPSQEVAQRGGFAREGLLRNWQAAPEGPLDLVMWSRLPPH